MVLWEYETNRRACRCTFKTSSEFFEKGEKKMVVKTPQKIPPQGYLTLLMLIVELMTMKCYCCKPQPWVNNNENLITIYCHYLWGTHPYSMCKSEVITGYIACNRHVSALTWFGRFGKHKKHKTQKTRNYRSNIIFQWQIQICK